MAASMSLAVNGLARTPRCSSALTMRSVAAAAAAPTVER
jgi:hypothetical protein